MLLLTIEAASFTSHHTTNFSSQDYLILAASVKLKKTNKELDALTEE